MATTRVAIGGRWLADQQESEPPKIIEEKHACQLIQRRIRRYERDVEGLKWRAAKLLKEIEKKELLISEFKSFMDGKPSSLLGAAKATEQEGTDHE